MQPNEYNPADDPAKNGFNFTPPRILLPIDDAQREAAFDRVQKLKDATNEALQPLSEQFED